MAPAGFQQPFNAGQEAALLAEKMLDDLGVFAHGVNAGPAGSWTGRPSYGKEDQLPATTWASTGRWLHGREIVGSSVNHRIPDRGRRRRDDRIKASGSGRSRRRRWPRAFRLLVLAGFLVGSDHQLLAATSAIRPRFAA